MKRPKRRIPDHPLARINTRKWRNLRDRVVREEPLCRLRLPGCTIISTTADHILPRKLYPQLTYVRSNLRGSCTSCNARRGDGSPRRMADVRARPPRRAPALRIFERRQ